MKPTRTTIIILMLLVFGIVASQAQGECAINVEEIVARVTEECQGIGQNQVCYGNRNVVATPRLNTVDFAFDEPGDIVSLSNVQSLFVSEIDPSNNEWGVAQMRLQVSSENGSQDMTMLLFGAFNVQNAVASTQTVLVSIRPLSAEIYAAPDLTSLSVETVQTGTQLLANGRLDDSSWIRVENQNTGIVGWINVANVQLVNSSQSIGILPVQAPDSQYYGAMQAFYFTSGATDLGCDNLASDGLLIQTPEGVARVSLLINEVSIELTGGGAGVAGTAYIEADPNNENGMEVSVMEGQAQVQTGGGEAQTVNAGQQSAIPMNDQMQPDGQPSIPINVDLSNVDISFLMPTFSTGSTSETSNGGVGDGSSVNIGGGNGSQSGSTNGGTGNGSNVTGNTGNAGNTTSNNGGTGNGSITIGGGNGSSNPNMPTSLDDIHAAQEASNRPIVWTQGNIIALTLAIIAAVLVIGGIVFYTMSSKKR